MSLKEKGSALVSALMLILMIASICTLWITQTHHQIRLFRAQEEQRKALQLSDSAQFWGIVQLQGRKIKQTSPLIASTNGKGFALPKGWHAHVRLIDAQSLFNINSVVEQNLKLSYFLLLKHFIPKENIQEIFFSSISWLEHNAKSESFNTYYAQQNPPYQNSEQLLVSLSELNKIKGFTPEIIKKLKPFLTALPESTPININTASQDIIGILKPNLKETDIKKIIFARGKKGFQSSAALFEILESFKIPPANVTINSQYFWLEYEFISPSLQKINGKCLLYRPLIDRKSVV